MACVTRGGYIYLGGEYEDPLVNTIVEISNAIGVGAAKIAHLPSRNKPLIKLVKMLKMLRTMATTANAGSPVIDSIFDNECVLAMSALDAEGEAADEYLIEKEAKAVAVEFEQKQVAADLAKL